MGEVEELAIKYWHSVTHYNQVLFNFFYSGGNIIKGVTNIIMYFLAKKYTRVKTPFKFGMELG